ncbi:helix-turn-helix domain-containing protein [Parabacteroides sp. Marseille-P3160]|uniref:helix-turn-helix domain-containing protein n=1 Tax=Parabacteroides sp. Marseille-P3160 TaxID=1917887 RepID=UPI00135AA40F|nr:helix-turn-helix transcriptional regulator [Parabacteroides sp. Marseille-P3160]
MDTKNNAKGAKFKKVREHLKMTQKEFSDLLGIKQSYYSAIERGEKNASSTVVNSLISIGVPADWYYSPSQDELPSFDSNLDMYTKNVNNMSNQNRGYNSIVDIEPLYKEGIINMVDIANTLAKYAISRYNIEHNTNFSVDLFQNISEELTLAANFFNLLGEGMKRELESKSIESLLKSKGRNPITTMDLSENEIIEKYKKVYDEYQKYIPTIHEIIVLAATNNPLMENAVKHILKTKD